MTQDYSHILELSNVEQTEIANAIKRCRVQRRNSKNTVWITEQPVEFLNGERGKMLIGQLQQVLGKVWREEKVSELCTYILKVLSQEAFSKHMVCDDL